MKYTVIKIIFLSLFTIAASVLATEYSLPKNGSRLIGYHEYYTVKKGDYFHSIARFYNIGLIALMESNPGIDPFLPPIGTKLIIPIRMLLPAQPYKGIVINLPEFRLYYFPEGADKVYVFPIGIGRKERPTPVMHSRIIAKITKPFWIPNARIKAEHLKKYGKVLPEVVPPGKDNPMGDYAMQLDYGIGNYWIHGTNQNFGIGMRVSVGCIRMNPDDIAWLFKQIKINDEVRIINQPVKIAIEPTGEKIIEVHSPLSTDKETAAEKVEFNKLEMIDRNELEKALSLKQGIPINIAI